MMPCSHPSRRQWLAALFAALFGWLWPGKSRAAAAPPAAVPSPWPKDLLTISRYDVGNCQESMGQVTTFVYEAQGGLTTIFDPVCRKYVWPDSAD